MSFSTPGPPASGGRAGQSRRAGCGPIAIIIVIIAVIIAVFVGMSGSRSSSSCGDYNLSGGTYSHDPGKGDYDKVGDSYQFVGCDQRSGGGGGFWFFGTGGGSGGGQYGSGSENRGGGSGFGK